MTGTATRTSHDQPPGRSDMNEHQREEHLRTACRAAGQEWRAVNEAAHPSPDDLDAACERARDAALAALAGAGLDGEEALALAERAALQRDDESEVPVSCAGHDASRYPAQVRSITWHLLADGYAVTWAPDPAGCSLTLDRHGPRGEHGAYRGTGPTMQDAWDEVRAQLGHGQPQPAGGITREAPGPARGSDRLYRVVQHYDSWPFHNDSRIPHGSKSRRRTDTFRTLGPVRDRLARANGYARYQHQEGGDWSSFVAIAEQLTDNGWQPIDVDLLLENPPALAVAVARAATAPSAPDPAPRGRGRSRPSRHPQRKGEDRERRPHHLPPARPASSTAETGPPRTLSRTPPGESTPPSRPSARTPPRSARSSTRPGSVSMPA